MTSFLRYLTTIATISAIALSSPAQSLESLPGAQFGYAVINLKTGQTTAFHNRKQAFIPASTLKCVTTAAALSCLGPQYTFDTYVLHNGSILNDTLYGNLIIVPSGDPSINDTICQHIARKGITHITGSVSIPASEPHIVPTAMIEDVGTDYGVGWSTFNYNGNRALINDSTVAMPLRHLVDDLIIDLYANGINIADNPCHATDTTLLFTHRSAPLGKLCRHMMCESDNLYAESVGRALDPDRNLSGAIDSMRVFLNSINIGATDMRIVDMSGLSRTNLTTPIAMARLLAAMADNRQYTASFPVVGRTGTVKRLLTKTRLAGRLILKSGSMTGVLAYAGYKIDTNGRPTHAVVIMVNNALCKQSTVKQAIESWLLTTF